MCLPGCYGLSHAPMLANAVKMLAPSHKRPLRSACFRNANTPKSQRSRVVLHSIAPINKPDNRESARPYCVSLIWTQCQNKGSDLLVNCISLIVNIWSSCCAFNMIPLKWFLCKAKNTKNSSNLCQKVKSWCLVEHCFSSIYELLLSFLHQHFPYR